MAVEIEDLINQPSESERRIKELSGKAKEALEKAETERVARETAETKMAEAERKAAFAESFADIVATNPAAREFKADIQAKVMSGYTPEDAAYAVLGKAGKIGAPASEEMSSPAGGSAPTNPTTSGPKPISEMSVDEKRAELEKQLS